MKITVITMTLHLTIMETEFSPPFTHMIESVVSKLKVQVDQYSEMRNFIKDNIKKSREDKQSNKVWSSRTIIQISDFTQNLDLPNFGSEQTGNIYYLSPLEVYLFGIVSVHPKKYTLSCQYFTEGEGAKGGNNVASMFLKKSKHSVFWKKVTRRSRSG